MSKKPISERLQEVLGELASLPKEEAYAAISEAVSEAYIDVGCGGSRPYLVRLMTEAAKYAARSCQYDMEELSHFYAQEARFDGSDHPSSDCLTWAHEYEVAALLMEQTADKLTGIGENIDKREADLDI